MLHDIDIAWLAGILEGEGYFVLCHDCSPTIQLKMADEDIVVRVAELFSRVSGREHNVYIRSSEGNKKYNSKWQDTYQTTIHGDSAQIIMRLIVGYMGYRRRQRIWQILNGYTPPKKIPSDVNILELIQTRKGVA